MTQKHTAHFDFDEGDGSLYEHKDGGIQKIFLPDPDCDLETFQEFKEKAAFIVRACNSHYQLLEALKSSLFMILGFEGTSDQNDEIVDKVRDAIAKSEGK